MKIVDLTQGDDAWLAWRKGGITATDAAILLDRSPYKTRWRLWAEKSGFAREVDLSLNPLVRRGERTRRLPARRTRSMPTTSCSRSVSSHPCTL